MWQYEGDFTLYDLMQKKEWPYNLEPLLFGRELNLPKSPRRRWITLRVIMQQVTSCPYDPVMTHYLKCTCRPVSGHSQIFQPTANDPHF